MYSKSTVRAYPRVMRRKLSVLVAVAAIVVVATGCSGTTSTASPVTSMAPTPVASAMSSSAASQAPASPAVSSTPIKIGVMAICGGPFATYEQEAFLGAKYALVKLADGQPAGQGPEDAVLNATVAGRPIQLYFGCTDATPDVAVAQARLLVEQKKVDILLGPESGDEGVAIANYAKTQPGVTFVNGTSGAQQTTLQVKAPNFFRFGGDGAQWMAGVGTYAYKTLGWRNVAILAEDYSYPYTLAAGFIAEFCAEGGKIAQRTWVPLGVADYSPYVAQLPRNIDGTLLLTGGTDTTSALSSYIAIGGNPSKMMLGGSSVMDPASFGTGDSLVGMVGGAPVPLGGTDSVWTDYVNSIGNVYPDVPAQSLFTVIYYDGMQAILEGLTKVNGDLSNNESAFQAALTSLTPSFPNGNIKLDANRDSVQPAYVVQFAKTNGTLGFKLLKTVASVDQTFGGLFSATSPTPSRTDPACQAGTPPPWASGF